jgi:hypothetical protein
MAWFVAKAGRGVIKHKHINSMVATSFTAFKVPSPLHVWGVFHLTVLNIKLIDFC